LGNMRRACAGYRPHRSKRMIEHIAPVAEHIENDAAVLFLLVVPRGPLRRLPVAFKDPVAKFAAHRQDAPEKARLNQPPQLAYSWQKQLILHDALLHA